MEGGWCPWIFRGSGRNCSLKRANTCAAGLDEARREFQEHEQRVAGVCSHGEGGTLTGLAWSVARGSGRVSSRFGGTGEKGHCPSCMTVLEELAREHGEDQVYNWVHPNNHRIISFLAKRGYDESRRARVSVLIENLIVSPVRLGEDSPCETIVRKAF